MNGYKLGLWSYAVRADSDNAPPCEEYRFVHDTNESNEGLEGHFVVSPLADGQRIDELVAAGAEQVLLGESALEDANLVTEAIARHGKERIGVWLPVRRAVSSWGLDTTSNADFSTVAVTNPLPRWVVVLEKGGRTDVDAQWWAGQMMAAGCSTVLVSVAQPEDDDLLACAEMVEIAGEQLWLDPGSANADELRFWIRYGQVRQLVLPHGCDAAVAKEELEHRLIQDEDASCTG